MKKTTKDWLQLLEDSGIPYGPINDVEQVFEDPQVGVCLNVQLPGTAVLMGEGNEEEVKVAVTIRLDCRFSLNT